MVNDGHRLKVVIVSGDLGVVALAVVEVRRPDRARGAAPAAVGADHGALAAGRGDLKLREQPE
jgi:hypothetical protein